MAEAAANVVAGEITQAVRDSSCDVGPIVEGDWLGLARDGIRAVEGALGDAATALLDVLVRDDHETVTIIEGDGASPPGTPPPPDWRAEHRPRPAAQGHPGAPPIPPYHPRHQHCPAEPT